MYLGLLWNNTRFRLS